MGSLSQLMGIINVTPDSFSDGGSYFDLDQFERKFDFFLNHPHVDFIDVGAESTAPFNQAISYEQERLRLEETLLKVINQRVWPNSKILSIDTYKLEIISDLYCKLNKINKSIPILWNDISGVLDTSTLNFLKQYPDLKYVLTHNQIPSRNESLQHKKYIEPANSNELYKKIKNFFLNQTKLLIKNGIDLNRCYFDPGFGFAKSREQNLMLMESLPMLILELKHTKWLIGLSRKSFLRDVGMEQDKTQSTIFCAEERLKEYMTQLSILLKNQPWLELTHRVHDPDLFLNR